MNHAAHASGPLHRVALRATIHCLTGCAIGEIAGMSAGAAFGWPNGQTVAVSIILAFITGFGMTMLPLLGAGLGLGRSLGLALASDTISISIMEVVDNALMMVIPGAMDAHVSSGLFWGSMLASLVLAGLAAFPVNMWLIGRGKGHAVLHAGHAHAAGAGAAPAAAPARDCCRPSGAGTGSCHTGPTPAAHAGHAGHTH